MDDSTVALVLIGRALTHLREMSVHADLDSPQARQELFAVSDLVHNLPHYLVSPQGGGMQEVLCADEPLARAWLQREMEDIESAERPRFSPSGGALRWSSSSRLA